MSAFESSELIKLLPFSEVTIVGVFYEIREIISTSSSAMYLRKKTSHDVP